jgi:hypothetical protein
MKFNPRTSTPLRRDTIRSHLVCLALVVQVAKILAADIPGDEFVGMLRNLDSIRLGRLFHAISIVVLAFNMLGNALRDLLDPRVRSR